MDNGSEILLCPFIPREVPVVGYQVGVESQRFKCPTLKGGVVIDDTGFSLPLRGLVSGPLVTLNPFRSDTVSRVRDGRQEIQGGDL